MGLGPTPGKSTSSSSGQRSVFSAPTPREAAIAIEIESLKSLYESQNVKFEEQFAKLREQNEKYQAQEQEMATLKRMVQMIMKEKQPSMGNNQECDVLV